MQVMTKSRCVYTTRNCAAKGRLSNSGQRFVNSQELIALKLLPTIAGILYVIQVYFFRLLIKSNQYT